MKKCIQGAHGVLLVALQVLSSTAGCAQQAADTLRYTAPEAEKIFLDNNLPLLAEKLNISQADARILQAGVWPNPRFALGDVQLFTNETADEIPPLFGNFWRNRTFAAQLEQLVYTAGKRRKNIVLETRNKALAEAAFTDLLHALKAEFRQNTSELLYLQSLQDDWQLQLAEVDKLLRAQQSQLREGNISQAELYRLKALQISLQGEANNLAEQMSEKQKALKTLMYVDPKSFLVISGMPDDAGIAALKRYTIDELMTRSGNNAAVQAARSRVKISEAQLTLERANRVPDITFNTSYDRGAGVIKNFAGVGFSMDLPVFNRNTGNIRVARLEVEKNEMLEKNKIAEWSNATVKAWTDLQKAIRLYEAIDRDYIGKLEGMTKAIARNFSQHNISLLEFLDFFESFRNSKEKYYEAIKNISLKKEDLNYLVGGEL